MDTQNYTNWIIGSGALVIILLGGWGVFARDVPADTGTNATSTDQNGGTTGGTSTTTDTGSTGTTAPTTGASGETLTVGDQPAGDSVRIESVTLTKTGWVAVRDSMRIYGAARLEAGTHENVSVPLLRNTESGTTYQVVVYVDDGDKKFDFKADSLVADIKDSFAALHGD